MESERYGVMESWSQRVMESESHGVRELWSERVMESGNHGVKGLWSQGVTEYEDTIWITRLVVHLKKTSTRY